MAQRDMRPATGVVRVALRQPAWPTDVPAPWMVREGNTPKFSILAGATGTTVAVSDAELVVTFPELDSQALLAFEHP